MRTGTGPALVLLIKKMFYYYAALLPQLIRNIQHDHVMLFLYQK